MDVEISMCCANFYLLPVPALTSTSWSSLVVEWVKDLVVLLLWLRFCPWHGDFHMLQIQSKKKKKITGVPIMGQWLMNPTSSHEISGSILGLAQGVKVPVLS